MERNQMKTIPYAYIVGSLLYAHTCTRPDISFAVAEGAISWKTMKQSIIAASSMKAELIACFEATIHGLWLRNFIPRLGFIESIAKLLRIYCDNSAAVFF
ncbi:chalcone synthase G-like [Cucumis melo var. makuwa]|uniref:Chalcone synthase G-like n=1 Tax=Cucumis melo var. makuwa TaxID=1194695 RepID=A0A5D3BR91_CUCMM|nr:chalcone synthase G-like [Cucumis melo var. makuwa]